MVAWILTFKVTLSIKNAIRDKLYLYKSHLIIHTVLRICPSSVFSTYSFSLLKVKFLSDWSILNFSFSLESRCLLSLAAFVFISVFIPMPPKNNNCCQQKCNLSFCNNFFFLFYVFLFNWNLEWFTYIKSFVKKRTLDFYFSLFVKKREIESLQFSVDKLWKQRRLILQFGYNHR